MQNIIGDTLIEGQAYEYDRQLADEIGPRLTGSPQYLKAISWAENEFKHLGLSNVHTETFQTDIWEPEPGASGRITAPVEHELHISSLGWSPSTPSDGVHGKVLLVSSIAPSALKQVGEKARGKVLLFSTAIFPKPWNEKAFLDGMQCLRELHPLAILFATGPSGSQSTGDLYGGTIADFPIGLVTTEDFELLRRLSGQNEVGVEFRFRNRTAKNVSVPQLVGEIRGSVYPDQVVVLGAHLDSWDPGTGAQDNGTGVATVVDAARELSSLPQPPKRTIRFVLFGGEEQGMIGSSAYVKAHRGEMGDVDAMLTTDTGDEAPLGWYLNGRDDEAPALAGVLPLLSGIGADGTTEDLGGMFSSDQASFDVVGVPTLLLWTPMSGYSKLHHKASDTFDSVNKKTLLLGDAVVTATTYAIAQADTAFAPHYAPGQVESMLKRIGQLTDYQALKAAGTLP